MSRKAKKYISKNSEYVSPAAREMRRENDRLAEIQAKGMTHRKARAIYDEFKKEAMQAGEWIPGCAMKVGV